MKNIPHLIGCIAACVLGDGMAAGAEGPAARKVYADYHSARYTREHDGALGLWKFSTVGRNSRLPNPVVNFNGDLVDEHGRHQLPTTDYPLAGMQSELDPDYLEYQVLSAKTAHIDGFFVEWGFFDHASERIRRALTAVAARYGFEIGINLCDRWLFTQLPARRPELKERELLVAEFIRNFDGLVRVLADEPTAARFRGRPVVFLFGDGLSPGEFDRLNRAIPPQAAPWVLIRPRLTGTPAPGGELIQTWDTAPWFDPATGFRPGVAGFFGWVPTRARTDGTGELRRQFDRYGTIGDSLDYLKLLAAAPHSGPRVSSATLGFDNRSSAGWGNDFSLLERGNGELYRAMWEFHLANESRSDWVFLPTWNDWTEGSQLEPSVEDQGAFLRLTAEAAARFKGESAAPALTELPLRLFQLRQRLRRLARIDPDHPLPLEATLDQAAIALSRRDPAARSLLDEAGAKLVEREQALPPPPSLTLAGDAAGNLSPVNAQTDFAAGIPLRFRLDDETATLLRRTFYEAVLEFDYKPTKRGRLEILTNTSRPSSEVGNYGVIADINLLEAGDWRPARVRVFAENCAWNHRLTDGSDLEFRGAAQVRNIRLTVNLFPAAP